VEESSERVGAPTPEEREVWRLYVEARTPERRGLLIERYLSCAHKIAAFLYSRRHDNTVEFADYLQLARVGLVEAIDRFDPSFDVNFETFASYRIRGAVLNGIHRYSEKSSQQTHRQAVMRERSESLQEQAEDDQTAEDSFEELVDVTIGLALGYILEDSNIWSAERMDRESDPYRSLEFKRLSERLGLIVQALPERERAIIRHHYFEFMEFNMVAELFGVSKGRISQLHARALQLIREAFDALEGFEKKF
jgi:RNA polymerase sigma factor for flagellar operon FliA